MKHLRLFAAACTAYIKCGGWVVAEAQVRILQEHPSQKCQTQGVARPSAFSASHRAGSHSALAHGQCPAHSSMCLFLELEPKCRGGHLNPTRTKPYARLKQLSAGLGPPSMITCGKPFLAAKGTEEIAMKTTSLSSSP